MKKKWKAHLIRDLYVIWTILTLGLGNIILYLINKPNATIKDIFGAFKVSWWLI